jgi:mRNA interferase MazF
MRNTIAYDFGDVILVPFPFTDQSATKKRPAIVVSSRKYHHDHPDLVLVAVTSQTRVAPLSGEAVISDWSAAGLLKPSTIKPVLATVDRRLVLRKLGRLQPSDVPALQKVLNDILGP